MTWQDLSDDELGARLRQRGMGRTDAQSWVEYRDAAGAPEQISYLLGEDSKITEPEE